MDEGDEGKIISIKPDDIYKNLEKLKSVEDKMTYALNTLFPARRLDYKNMKLTTETSVDKLNAINFLMLSNPRQFVLMIIKPITLMESRFSKLPMI